MRPFLSRGCAPLLLSALACGVAAPELAAQATEQSYVLCPWYKPANYWSSALASDNDWLISGAPRDSLLWPLVGHGAVSVHRRDPVTGAWIHHQTKYASDYSSDDRFGFAVAAEGDVFVASALHNQVSTLVRAGSVYVFRKDPVTGLFVEEQRLDSIVPATDEFFGHALALKGDVLLVGAPNTFISGTQVGSVQVFRRDPGTGVWSFEAQLLDDDPDPGAAFGSAIAFDGTTAVIGAPDADQNFVQNCGSVELFTVSGTTWTKGQEILSPTLQTSGNFGAAVALSSGRIAVGVPSEHNGANLWVGAVRTFALDSGTGLYTHEQRLLSTISNGSRFGAALALDGSVLAVGEYGVSTGGGQSGVAWTYRLGKKSNGPWHLESQLTAGSTWVEEEFGHAVAIDAKHVLVGSRYTDTSSGYDSGAIYLYDKAEFTLSVTPTQPAPGATIDLEAHRGAPGAPILLAVEAIDSIPVFIPLLYDVFAADYRWSLQLDAPDPAFGSTVSVRAWKIGAGGPLVGSNVIDVDL